jgi:cobalt/nickel transport system permease protein
VTIRLLDPYHPGAGPLHRADPRLKLVAALGWILLINVTPAGRWPLYVAHLLAWLGVMLASRVPPWAVARRSLVALPFVLLAALGAPWGVDGHAVWTGDLFGWRLALTDAGLLRLATILARALLSVLVAVGLGATTHVVAVVRAARALGLPAVLAAVILLMYRYLYVLVDEAGRLMRARDARSAVCAGRRAGRSLGWRARVTGHMIATLFLRTYERGERMYQAMLARGYTGDPGAFGTSAGGLPAHAEEYAPEEVSAGGPGGEPMIEVQDLAYTYPDGHAALRGVSLSVAPGEKVALVGPNGAGKSTLLLHLNGLLRGEGRVRVAGLEVDERTARRVRARVGLVFQDPDDQLFSPTVLDDVAFGPLHMGLADAEALGRSAWALGQVHMEQAAERLPHHLSLGEKKRVAVATVLAMHPDVLALDEPSAGLDPAARRNLLEVLGRLPQTMLVASHDLAFVRDLCSRAIVLHAGHVVADVPIADLDESLLAPRREADTADGPGCA